MKRIIRWLAGLAAAVMLTFSGLLGLFCLAATDWWAERAMLSGTLQARQQSRIDDEAAELAARWHVSPDTLAPYVERAAEVYTQSLISWWHAIWHDPDADPWLPVYLSAAGERELIAAVMADEQFASAQEGASLRALARDEVAYGLDEIVCRAVLPLRRSVVELLLSMATARVQLTQFRQAVGAAGGVLAGLALVLTALNRKDAGVTLITAGGMMALASVPVWLLDVHRMLRQLNSVAAVQGDCILLWLALPWYAAALLLVILGSMIIRIRTGRV